MVPASTRCRQFEHGLLALLTLVVLGHIVPNEYRTLTSHTQSKTLVNNNNKSKNDAATFNFALDKSIDEKEPELEIAWLMSFPNSGTSYTGRLIRHISMAATGSNYGNENNGYRNTAANVSVPVFADQPTGPFYIYPEEHIGFIHPSRYLLTKTHCGGRCNYCAPESYTETSYSFRNRCLSGKRFVVKNGTTTMVRGSYSPKRVKKAVHLFRNPFDNVVSRFRYHVDRRPDESQTFRDFPKSKEGFRDFCMELNQLYARELRHAVWLTPELDELTRDIPCRADFFRYVEWHSNAALTTYDMNLEVYMLHYDWYSTRFEETATELLDFLSLERKWDAEPPPFLAGKVYSEFFSEDERARMKVAMKYMASADVWKQIERYFA